MLKFLSGRNAATIKTEASKVQGVKSVKSVTPVIVSIVGDKITKYKDADGNEQTTEYLEFVVTQGTAKSVLNDGLNPIVAELEVGSRIKVKDINIAAAIADHIVYTYEQKEDPNDATLFVNDLTKIKSQSYPQGNFILEITPTKTTLVKKV